MHTGMLWFDNSQSTFEIKAQKAVEYYQKKYGRKPDLILAHPLTVPPNSGKSFEIKVGENSLTVRAYRPVLPGHIWVGIEDKE